MPAPQISVSFSSQMAALRERDALREAHERRMLNALEILSDAQPSDKPTGEAFALWVRSVAREGLGRDAAA